MKAPLIVLDDRSRPAVLTEAMVAEHFGRTFAVAGRRNTGRLYLPLHVVGETMRELAPAIIATGIDMDAVIQTFRCGRREGIAQVTVGALVGAAGTVDVP